MVTHDQEEAPYHGADRLVGHERWCIPHQIGTPHYLYDVLREKFRRGFRRPLAS